MNSSKKFMTRILTAALAISMVASITGVCASAVEDTAVEEEPIVIMASRTMNRLNFLSWTL